jgi:hypothetical protein
MRLGIIPVILRGEMSVLSLCHELESTFSDIRRVRGAAARRLSHCPAREMRGGTGCCRSLRDTGLRRGDGCGRCRVWHPTDFQVSRGTVVTLL